MSADEICRRLNVSRATLYQWKRKYGGLEVSQLKKLKELEEENAKLKKMYANLALDNEILREVIEKNSRAEWYYESTKDDSEVEAVIRQKAEVTNEGFWKIFRLIRKDGHPWNHKKVHRVYEAIHFNKRKPLRKRLPARVKNPLVTPEQENVTWSMDFVTDVLQSNRKFRVHRASPCSCRKSAKSCIWNNFTDSIGSVSFCSYLCLESIANDSK